MVENMANGYTINEIYEAALTEWHLKVETGDTEVDTQEAIKKKIKRSLDEWLGQAGYQRQNLPRRGRERLYPISSPESFVTSAVMYTYFDKRQKESRVDVPQPITITDEEIDSIQGNEEDLILEQLNGMTAKLAARDKVIQKQHYIERQFENRKYKVMLDALFSESFELNQRKLKQDLQEIYEFDKYHSLAETTKEIEATRERLKHNDQYYSKKSQPLPDDSKR